MKTVGEILKQARTLQGISIATVAAKTKIQVKYLRALEADDLKSLPAAPFVKGFIRNYAYVVGKNPDSLLAIFRRDYDQNKTGQVVLRSAVISRKWQWTPKLTMISVTALVVTVFLGYLLFQLRLLARPPQLTVTTPQEEEVVRSNVEVMGKADADASVVVNNKPVIVNSTGEFVETVLLPSGKHTITVKATARNGKDRTILRTVIVE
ncbi:MAG: helix-turn-helix domain-containing protein [Candidatus Chisholmbacteria bacterium]|nr:helix-turn-helix domain-containing protein [Candidatus Chisholmbacteria bacterium]